MFGRPTHLLYSLGEVELEWLGRKKNGECKNVGMQDGVI